MKRAFFGLLLVTTFAVSTVACTEDASTEGTVLHSEITANDFDNLDRRDRIATFAREALDRLPTAAIDSDHVLDVAVSESLNRTAMTLRELSEAETMTKEEVRSNVSRLTRRTDIDATGIQDILTTLGDSDGGRADSFIERSCTKMCLDEWKECLEEFGSPLGVGGAAVLCAITLEVCWADCLLPG